MGKSQRILYIDALKLFAIFLVLWGHAIQYLISGEYFNQPVYRIIYAFHMPLFMALSGYFVTQKSVEKFGRFVLKKGRQLLLPLVSAVGVFYLFLKFRHLPHDNFMVMSGNMLWFLKSAFVCSVLYAFATLFGRFKTPALLLMFVLIVVALPCDVPVIDRLNLKVMFPSFLTGVCMRNYSTWIRARLPIVCSVSCIIFIAMLVGWDARFWTESGIIPTGTAAYYLILPYRILIGVSGSVFFITLFELLSSKIPETKSGTLVCSMGSYTLGIYILQTFLLELFLPQYINFDSQDTVLFSLVTAPLISLGIMILCLCGVKIIGSNRFMAFLFLGQSLHR